MHTNDDITEIPLRPGRIARVEEVGSIKLEYDAQGRLLCVSLDGRSNPNELASLLERRSPCALNA